MIELSAGSGIERIVSVAVVKVTCQSPFVSHRLEPADIQCSPVAIFFLIMAFLAVLLQSLFVFHEFKVLEFGR